MLGLPHCRAALPRRAAAPRTPMSLVVSGELSDSSSSDDESEWELSTVTSRQELGTVASKPSVRSAATAATDNTLHWPYDTLVRNEKKAVGLSERLAKHAALLGYDDAAARLRVDERERKERERREQRQREARRDFEIAKLKLAAAAAKAGQRRCDVRAAAAGDADLCSFDSTATNTSRSTGVVRVGARSAKGRSSTAVTVSSSGSSRASSRSRSSASTRGSSGGDWFVASAGPYEDPRDVRSACRAGDKSKFLHGDFRSASGKRSAMPTRAPGGVSRAGPTTRSRRTPHGRASPRRRGRRRASPKSPTRRSGPRAAPPGCPSPTGPSPARGARARPRSLRKL